MAGSYVSQLVSGKLTPQEFVAKSADWMRSQKIIPASHLNWLVEAAEKLLIAKGLPPFVAEIITNEIKEALGINPVRTDPG
jgi:hypothetical protein